MVMLVAAALEEEEAERLSPRLLLVPTVGLGEQTVAGLAVAVSVQILGLVARVGSVAAVASMSIPTNMSHV